MKPSDLPKSVSASGAQDQYLVPALMRGLQVLGLFTHKQPELTGADISRSLDLPRASVFRLLQTLEHMGYLERSPNGIHYRLGMGVLRLGFEYIASQDISELARPVVDALRDASGVTAHLVIRDGKEVVFVLKALGRNAVFQTIPIGTRLPVHATALGRTLLMYMSDAQLNNLFMDHQFTVYTSHTPRNLQALKDKIQLDAQLGYSVSEGGFESGISVVAAPVRNAQGQVVAALSISVPASRIETTKQQHFIQLVCQHAHELTQRLSHMPQTKTIS